MRFIQYTIRLCIALAVLTVIGQMRFNNRSLESRYHEAVTSQSFQEAYWALMTPITYTYGKAISVFKKDSASPMAR